MIKGLFFDRTHLNRCKGVPLLAKNIKSSFRSSHVYNKIMKRTTHLDGTRNTSRYVTKHHRAQYNQIQRANNDDKQVNKLVENATYISCEGIIRDHNKQHDELNVKFHEQTSITCPPLSTTSNEYNSNKYISCTKLLELQVDIHI